MRIISRPAAIEANIQLTGSVQVNKVRNNYVLSGTLQAPRGTYRLLIGFVTREFVVSQGTVRYFGTPDLNAELDIAARHIVHPLPGAGITKDITVIAHIQGTLLVPKLTLESDQGDLSQTELISYLMFGKPTFELGGGEAPFVRNVFASLFAGELERTFVSDLGVPLDYFEIRPGDPNNPFAGAQVAAGWAIGAKTFLVVNAGFCQPNQGNQSSRLTNTLGASHDKNGASVSVDGSSRWIVTQSSYLTALDLAQGGKIEAAPGYRLSLSVDGKRVVHRLNFAMPGHTPG